MRSTINRKSKSSIVSEAIASATLSPATREFDNAAQEGLVNGDTRTVERMLSKPRCDEFDGAA